MLAVFAQVEGVVGAFLASNFVTVTKRPESSGPTSPRRSSMRLAFADGGPRSAGYREPARAEQGEVVARIVRILEEEIRPAVAMDGGDIVFAGFRDGIVELYMHGSCSGCAPLAGGCWSLAAARGNC
jgi:hypothetical protein